MAYGGENDISDHIKRLPENIRKKIAELVLNEDFDQYDIVRLANGDEETKERRKKVFEKKFPGIGNIISLYPEFPSLYNTEKKLSLVKKLLEKNILLFPKKTTIILFENNKYRYKRTITPGFFDFNIEEKILLDLFPHNSPSITDGPDWRLDYLTRGFHLKDETSKADDQTELLVVNFWINNMNHNLRYTNSFNNFFSLFTWNNFESKDVLFVKVGDENFVLIDQKNKTIFGYLLNGMDAESIASGCFNPNICPGIFF